MNQDLFEAFEQVRNGFSSDRVVADPSLNMAFIEACRHRGNNEPAVELNLALLNARKRGGLPRSRHRTVLRDQDAYAFAAEIAIRSLERKHRTTLDRVLCDPVLAAEFDKVAKAISPGHTPLEYRWAALCLRKQNRLKPEILGRVVPAQVVGPLSISTVALSSVSDGQGLYILIARDKVLYVGETRNLRSRLKKHLDHSDNKMLARYLWSRGADDLLIEYHVLPKGTRVDVRRAMELELIRSRSPELNTRR